MSADEPTDPGALAAAATGDVDPDSIQGPTETPEQPDPEAGGSEGSGSVSPIDLLLSTEPDETPEADYPDLPPHTAHIVIGIKKMLNEALGGKMTTGTPAAENLARGAIGFVQSRDTGESGDDEQPGDWGEL